MLTQCSQCKKTYSLSIDELRSRSTVLVCPHCEEMLGRLKVVSQPDFFANPKKNSSIYFEFWAIGFFACVVLFLTQVYLTERDKLSQNPEQRVWLEKVCQSLACDLPVYKNLEEIENLHSSFEPIDNNHYLFQAVISNQAEFPQHYPRIKLSLLDFSGQVFAERVFYPRQYLKAEPIRLMSASETIEVSLEIAPPSQKVGGYKIDLI